MFCCNNVFSIKTYADMWTSMYGVIVVAAANIKLVGGGIGNFLENVLSLVWNMSLV